jgi:nicotinamide mononucleotide adenylyltransferase
MSEENTTADVEADQNTTEIHNTSLEEFTQRRLGAQPEAVTAEVEEPTESSEESEEATEVAETQSEENVLSQLDIDNLSEAELKELSEKLGSRAVARFGEMTARRKAAEERVSQLEASLKDQSEQPFTREVKNNPFGDLETMQDVKTKMEEVDTTIEWAEDVLFESDSYSAEDVVTEVDGKELTKKDVRKALLNARKAQKTFLPDQLNKINARVQGAELQKSFDNKARQELDWLNPDNPTRQQFVNTMRDPRYIKMKNYLDKEAPDLSSQLEYWFAHATNSMYGRQPIDTTPVKKATKKGTPSLTPTKTGSSASTKSEKPTSKTKKALADLQNRFQQTGSARDFAEMRKIQMQNR